jgi:hypothetical protein
VKNQNELDAVGESEDDLLGELDVAGPEIVSEPLVTPKLTMAEALAIDLGPLDDVAAYIANYETGTEAPRTLDEITLVKVEPSDPMLTCESEYFVGDSEEQMRKFAAADLITKMLFLKQRDPEARELFSGRKLDEESMIVTVVFEDDTFVNTTAIGRWVKK